MCLLHLHNQLYACRNYLDKQNTVEKLKDRPSLRFFLVSSKTASSTKSCSTPKLWANFLQLHKEVIPIEQNCPSSATIKIEQTAIMRIAKVEDVNAVTSYILLI